MHLASSYPILTGREERPASSVIPLQLRRGAVENTNIWVQSVLPNLFQTDPVAIVLPACRVAHTLPCSVNTIALMDSLIHPCLPRARAARTTCVLGNWCDRLRLTVACFSDLAHLLLQAFWQRKVGGFWFPSNLTNCIERSTFMRWSIIDCKGEEKWPSIKWELIFVAVFPKCNQHFIII